MPVWGALLGTLGYNVARHLRGKSTLCSSARPILPAWAFDLAWGELTKWIRPHYRNGFR